MLFSLFAFGRKKYNANALSQNVCHSHAIHTCLFVLDSVFRTPRNMSNTVWLFCLPNVSIRKKPIKLWFPRMSVAGKLSAIISYHSQLTSNRIAQITSSPYMHTVAFDSVGFPQHKRKQSAFSFIMHLCIYHFAQPNYHVRTRQSQSSLMKMENKPIIL